MIEWYDYNIRNMVPNKVFGTERFVLYQVTTSINAMMYIHTCIYNVKH